jgi:hypothetical protein
MFRVLIFERILRDLKVLKIYQAANYDAGWITGDMN